MKKRLLNLLLVLIMVACVLPMAVSATEASTCIHARENATDPCTVDLIPKKEANCYEDGYEAYYKCTVCEEIMMPVATDTNGLSYVVGGKIEIISATGNHAYTVDKGYREGDEPTCTETGIRVMGCSTPGCTATTAQTAPVDPNAHKYVDGVCTECNDCESDHVHNKIVTHAKAATCTEDGYINPVYQCKKCGIYFCKNANRVYDYNETGVFADNVIPAGHKWENGVCTVCDECQNNHVSNKIITAAAPATCGTPGARYNVYQCKVCGDFFCNNVVKETNDFPENVIPATGKHNYVLDHWVDQPVTCTTDAIGVFKCSVCGDPENITKYAMGHDWDITVLQEATCTIKGMEFQKCKREGCGFWRYVETEATGHNIVTVNATAPTCTTTGLTAGEKCDRCGWTKTPQTVVDKLPHDWEDVEAEPATCKADGFNDHKRCKDCGETDGKVVIPANNTGHNYVNNKCTICGEYDPAHEHEGTGRVTTAATCTSAGVMTYTCNGCDHTWTEPIAMTSHNYVSGECTVCHNPDPNHVHSYTQTGYTAPGCTAKGQIIQVCSVCRNETKTDIDPLGHSYVNGVCTRCDEPNPAEVCNHTNTYTETVDATCTRDGYEKEICVCDHVVSTRILEATGHSYVNGVCSVCKHKDSNRVTNDYQDVFMLEEN